MNAYSQSSRLATAVRDPKWCGALHRDHAAELLGVSHAELRQVIAIAYRRGLIDLCWDFIVPAPGETASGAAA